MKANELDKKFDDGEEDILQYFDLSKGERFNQKQKRVNVDFPQWMINSLDRESKRIGVTRQSLIKMWLADRLEKIG
ncbi:MULTISPECIES: CopG family transcriptional regulator [unclassified Ekhidna]|jgi:hypothetical protein|uniref:type II toxin-antitoxin system BrnA family antitoxin n=1 Tax=unclassified Ekhidna TaxID=2632188 RepID=UPI0032E04F75